MSSTASGALTCHRGVTRSNRPHLLPISQARLQELHAARPYGSERFEEAFRRATEGTLAVGAALRSKAGSVNAALAAYLTSTAWKELAPGTQTMRCPIFERFRISYGELPLGRLHAPFLEAYLSSMKPHAARNAFKALRGFLKHARHDVTRDIAPPKAKSEPHHSWMNEEIGQYEAHHPVGTKARLCLALVKYTGQRRSDIARIGRQHIAAGVLYVKQKKTGAEVWIPVHPELQAIIDRTPGEHLTLLVTQTGRPYSAGNLSEQFRAWCDQAGLPQRCVMHGMRHPTGAFLADLGCTPHEISSILGCSEKMTLHYSQKADRKRNARRVMDLWVAASNREPKVSNSEPILTIQCDNALKRQEKK